MCVCVCVCACAHVCMYVLRIVSTDQILCFLNTLIIIIIYDLARPGTEIWSNFHDFCLM